MRLLHGPSSQPTRTWIDLEAGWFSTLDTNSLASAGPSIAAGVLTATLDGTQALRDGLAECVLLVAPIATVASALGTTAAELVAGTTSVHFRITAPATLGGEDVGVAVGWVTTDDQSTLDGLAAGLTRRSGANDHGALTLKRVGDIRLRIETGVTLAQGVLQILEGSSGASTFIHAASFACSSVGVVAARTDSVEAGAAVTHFAVALALCATTGSAETLGDGYRIQLQAADVPAVVGAW